MEARDGGEPSLSASAVLAVTVSDLNDSPPEFSETEYSLSVPENEPSDVIVGEIEALDRDEGSAANLTFALFGEYSNRYMLLQYYACGRRCTVGEIRCTGHLIKTLFVLTRTCTQLHKGCDFL